MGQVLPSQRKQSCFKIKYSRFKHLVLDENLKYNPGSPDECV